MAGTDIPAQSNIHSTYFDFLRHRSSKRAPDSPVFVMAQTIYDADNKIIAWGKSIFRGARYKLVSYAGWNVAGIKDEGRGAGI
jgi:DNA-binding GntR family transcriptional regulator